MTPSLGTLPRELKAKVASEVREKVDLFHLSLVSRCWPDIVRPLLYATLSRQDVFSLANPSALSVCKDALVHTRQVSLALIDPCRFVTDSHTAPNNPVMRQAFEEEMDWLFAGFVRALVNLRHITVFSHRQYDDPPDEDEPEGAPAPQGMDRSPRYFSTFTLHALFTLPHLTSISIEEVQSRFDISIAAQLIMGCPALDRFALNLFPSMGYVMRYLMPPDGPAPDETVSRQQLVRAIYRSRTLTSLELTGPCIVDVASLPGPFLPRLTRLGVRLQMSAENLVADMIAASSATLTHLGVDAPVPFRLVDKQPPSFSNLSKVVLEASHQIRPMHEMDIACLCQAPIRHLGLMGYGSGELAGKLLAKEDTTLRNLERLDLARPSAATISHIGEMCAKQGISFDGSWQHRLPL